MAFKIHAMSAKVQTKPREAAAEIIAAYEAAAWRPIESHKDGVDPDEAIIADLMAVDDAKSLGGNRGYEIIVTARRKNESLQSRLRFITHNSNV